MRLPTYWSWRVGTLRCESQRKHSCYEQGIPAIQTNSFWNTWGDVVGSATRTSLLFPISPQASSISPSPRICFSRAPKIASRVSFRLLMTRATAGPEMPTERKSNNWQCGCLNACLYFPGVDHWHLKGDRKYTINETLSHHFGSQTRVKSWHRPERREEEQNKIIRVQTAPLCTRIGWMTLGETHTSISFKCKLSLKPLGWWQLDTQNT